MKIIFCIFFGLIFTISSKADLQCYYTTEIIEKGYIGKLHGQHLYYELRAKSHSGKYPDQLLMITTDTLESGFDIMPLYNEHTSSWSYGSCEDMNTKNNRVIQVLMAGSGGTPRTHDFRLYNGQLYLDVDFTPIGGMAEIQHHHYIWEGNKFIKAAEIKTISWFEEVERIKRLVKDPNNYLKARTACQKLEQYPDGNRYRFPQDLFMEFFFHTWKMATKEFKAGSPTAAAGRIEMLFYQKLFKKNHLADTGEKEGCADMEKLKGQGYVICIDRSEDCNQNRCFAEAYYFIPKDINYLPMISDCARYLQMAGKNQETAYLLKQVLRHHPDYLPIQLILADALWKLGADNQIEAKMLYKTYYYTCKKKGQESNVPKRVKDRF